MVYLQACDALMCESCSAHLDCTLHNYCIQFQSSIFAQMYIRQTVYVLKYYSCSLKGKKVPEKETRTYLNDKCVVVNYIQYMYLKKKGDTSSVFRS